MESKCRRVELQVPAAQREKRKRQPLEGGTKKRWKKSLKGRDRDRVRKIIAVAFWAMDCILATAREVNNPNPVAELRSGCVPDPAAVC